MRKAVPLVLLGLLALGATGCATTAAKDDKMKAVYHINSDDPKTLKAALGNVQNHLNAVGKDKADIKVVMHGNGLAMLQLAKTDEDVKTRVDKLKFQGVAFNVCGNTLAARKINKTDLYDVSDKDIVPSGVAEIAILQGKGYAYIKP